MLKRLAVLGVVFVLAGGPAARAEADKDVQTIVDKAIKAHGGADNLKKFTASTSKMKGTVNVNDMEITFSGTSSTQFPDKQKTELTADVNGMQFTVTQAINGNKGWMDVNGTVMDMNKEMLEATREQIHAAGITGLRTLNEKGNKLSSLGEVKVGDKTAVGVRVQREGFRDVNVFFDKDKGLLLRAESRGKDPMSGEEFTAESTFSDYKDVGGIQMPHKLLVKRDGKKYLEAELSDIKPTEKLDDSTFAKP